jgi:hypothetical protein
MEIKVKQGWFSIALQFVMIFLLIVINFRIPNLLQTQDLYIICTTPKNNPGEVTLNIYNSGNYISNGTISLNLLIDGVYAYDDVKGFVGSLSPNSGKNYEFKFNKEIPSYYNYTIFIRIESNGRTKEQTTVANWYP